MASGSALVQRPDRTPPEREIVLACARAVVEAGAKDRVRALACSGLRWPDVVADAAQHGLTPVVYEVVANVAQDLITAEQLNSLRESTAASRASSMALVGELLRVYQLFEAAKIPIIPFKGPLLAWIAYGSFIRREYSDLDFAVQQQFIPAAAAVMNLAGYRPLFDPGELHAGQKGFAPGQYSFRLGSQNLLVEFHTERTLRYYPRPVDFHDLTRRLMTVEISGQHLRTFSIEDTVVMLCVHGAKHFWERLLWILDVAKLLTVEKLDPSLLLEIAARMESTRVLMLGLYLAHELLNAPIPSDVRERIYRDRAVRELAERVYDQYARASDPGGGVWHRTVFRFRSRDGFGQGLRHMLRLALSPTESDRQTVYLPHWLSPLYTVVRPWRLLREHGLGLKRR